MMPDVNPPCNRCGGPHPFDTSVPSVIWNAVVRAQGLPEYLCLTCIVDVFARAGESFTATLWGGPFRGGLSIEVRVGGEVATDAAALSEENTRMRAELHLWEEREAACCPEDVGFEEYIVVLKSRLARHGVSDA